MSNDKKVFISYAWGDDKSTEWIVNFATRLVHDSVDVELDLWSLKDGQDKNAYMESMVGSEEVFRVLIICDENYQKKANERKGGVGTETQIITPEVYKDFKQEKFIPILREYDDEGSPCLPIFLTSRIYIDFSKDELFEASYEKLLRNILEAPALAKPKLGKEPPRYITESSGASALTKSSLRTLKTQVNRSPSSINDYSADFLRVFRQELHSVEFKCESNDLVEFGKNLMDVLSQYREIREDYIDFLNIVTRKSFNLDSEVIQEFFSQKFQFTKPSLETKSYRLSDYEFYKIVFHELFLYTICCCLHNKNYLLAENLLQAKYYLKDEPAGRIATMGFEEFYEYAENFENYYKQEFRKISGIGDYMISSLSEKISKEEFILTDLICHTILELIPENDSESRWQSWFPTTYVYGRSIEYEFFVKMSSKKHFENVKGIFGCNSLEEFKLIINQYKEKVKGKPLIRYGSGFENIPRVYQFIDVEKLGIYP